MKRIFLAATILSAAAFLTSFCGMYVSSADGTIKNKTSEVILVRDGNRNVITMYNDFKGDDKDFAMIVPVPVVLAKKDIKVISADIFKTLNSYSAPRLVEYYDENPCDRRMYEADMVALAPPIMEDKSVTKSASANGVKIEAQYLVGEYDILILSASQNKGLRTWLTDNGYKIPANADEVLEPYIRNNLKFFVVKVNEKEKAKLKNDYLRPIQISFTSERFMLPIRLGMANADGDQDLIVYAFTKKGRVECSNYRNKELPTDENVPLFVKQDFGTFYNNLFQHQWQKEGKSVAMVEYAWDVSPENYVKCDPCSSTPPNTNDLVQSGVWWLNDNTAGGNRNWEDYSDVDATSENSKKVFFTRMHFRYNRQSFPQDLSFQVTPNTQSFQCRYVLHHPAIGDFSCTEGQQYLNTLKKRRRAELVALQNLTGTNRTNWKQDMTGFADGLESPANSYATLAEEMPLPQKDGTGKGALALAGVAVLGVVGLAGSRFLGKK